MYTNEEYYEMVPLRNPLSRATHLQQIPTEDVLGYALAHPESSVLDISKKMKVPYGICHAYGTSRMVPSHINLAQPCTFLAQTFGTRIIGNGGQEVAETTGGVSDAGLVLQFCGRQSF
ncbi:hypothetical protein TNCV_807801 [Trichonephila clavipes]|nr:hypothetical protein TNCV_807801 [Trichonephila clavipes]